MLSRVAESLYWTARYVERAEDVARLLDVNFHALLDAQVEDRGQAWQQLVALLGDEALYREHFEEYTAASVADFLLWHPGNPNAVGSCVALARENARSVREQISGEMWEAINRLYLLVRSESRSSTTRGPHAFFDQLRTGAHLFQGTTDATMLHGELREFIQLGLHLERATTTVRVVAARYPVAAGLPEDSPARSMELISLLKSCSAFEAYLKYRGTALEPWPAADYLIRSTEFPRAVLHCLQTCVAAVDRVSPGGGEPHRILGRLGAELEYGEMYDVSGETVRRLLDRLLAGIHEAGEAITRAYFSSQALTASALGLQEGQQQQCG